MTQPTVPETTLAQLGGSSRLQAMIGAKLFSQSGNELQFRFTANNKMKANCLVITLAGADLYNVRILSIRGLKITEKKLMEAIPVENLKPSIEHALELRLSL